MQRSIASFFQPKGKDKAVEKKTEAPVKKPTKSPLKVQNGIQEAESPIKKVVKRSRQILDSDDDEVSIAEDQVTIKMQENKEAIDKTEQDDDVSKAVPTPLSPPPAMTTPVTPSVPSTPASSATPGTPGTPSSISPSGIVKRKTARKTFPKRRLDESRSSSESRTGEAEEEPRQQNKRPRVESGENGNEPMEEESAEKALTETHGAEEEVENEKKEEEEERDEEKGKKAEGAKKKNEAKEKTVDERGPSSGDEEVEKDTGDGRESPKSQMDKKQKAGKEQKDKEPAKKAPISSFFVPRKAAVKKKEPEKKEAEAKSVEKKSSSEESKNIKGESSSGQTDYDPSRPGYHPVDHACWHHGQKVPYLAVARTFQKIEEDSGRLRNIETLSNLFRSVLLLSPDDLLCCVYLCLNQLGPAYLGLELGVGEMVLMKALAQATGRQLDKIKAEAQDKGDLGLVAESSRSNQRMMFQPASLTAGGVFKKLKEIASMSGNSAMNKKIDIIKGLFVACRFSEARYIVRSLAGKLRIGLAEQSVLAALSQAVCLTPPGQDFPPAVTDAGKEKSTESKRAWMEEKSLILKQTYCEMPNYDVIIPVLLKEGIDQLPNHCKLTPGVPLRPMLAHPTKGVGEVMKKFDEAMFTCEYKYDGERAQIHILENGEVRIFSRNQEDNTSKYPDIISRVPKVKGLRILPYLDNWLICAPTYAQAVSDTQTVLAHVANWCGRHLGEAASVSGGQAVTICPVSLRSMQMWLNEVHIIPSRHTYRYKRLHVSPQCLDSLSQWRERSWLLIGVLLGSLPSRRDVENVPPARPRGTSDVGSVLFISSSWLDLAVWVSVCCFAFVCVQSLVRQPLCRRRALLRESFSEVEGEFVFARSIDSNNTDAIAEFLEQSVRDSCEGLMVKTLEKDATYEIAKRSHNWLKLKKDYLEGVGDTVDLCVIGAYLGKGKRAGTYGGFLLACYDEENEEFQSVCKIGTGFKDDDLEHHYKFLKEHILPKPRAYYRVDQSAEPDVWLDAVQVWEVKCADLSLSPVYKAAMGLVDPVKGISLRFPRFIRIRDDKKPEDATSGQQIADLYKKQQQIQNQGDKADLEDYY
ncbi:DNA ligase 1 [Thalassophryne amazonica]|uniref:DNA ligase 1 n=1 Tax=Thalassophryne amazonica TaxID=390379 RepID=UPI001472229F|nr:DNA ligase 1 [Thalassophryne amazonica]